MDASVFRFRVAANLRFGIGESEKLGEEILTFGFQKVAAIIDKGVVSNQQDLLTKQLDHQQGLQQGAVEHNQQLSQGVVDKQHEINQSRLKHEQQLEQMAKTPKPVVKKGEP